MTSAAFQVLIISAAILGRALRWTSATVSSIGLPFGLTFALETHAARIDETTAAVVRSYGTEFRLAIDREIVQRRRRGIQFHLPAHVMVATGAAKIVAPSSG